MVDNNQPDDEDVEDSKDNLVRRRADEEVAMKAFRLTREKDQQFSIDLGDGRVVLDKRPLQAGSDFPNTPTAKPSASDKPPSGSGGTASGVPVTSSQGKPTAPSSPAPQAKADGGKAAPEASAAAAAPKPKPLRLTPYMQARLQLQAECFGVIIQPSGHALEYIRDINGREISLFTEPASEQGLNAAEANLKRLANDTINLLSAKFGVTFSKPDEVVADGSTIFGRQPSLIELDAAGEALSVSDPAHRTANQARVRICFVDSKKKEGSAVGLTIHPDGNVDILVLPHASKVGQNNVHAVAHLYIEALAVHTVYKTGRSQIQQLPSLAQNIAHFRSGIAERKQLLKDSKQLYEKAKEIDQWEINKEYGLQADGTETKVRLPNGKLVNNKPEMREEITRFEQGVT